MSGDVKIGPEDELVDCVAVCQEDGPVSKVCLIFSMFDFMYSL
jgi:hypothetical protein